MLLLKALAAQLLKEHANKFLDNVQAANAEFTFDALLKFVTRTAALLEGDILQGGGVRKLSVHKGGTTNRMNKEHIRQVTTTQSSTVEETR